MPVLNVGKQIHNLSLGLILTLGKNNLQCILLDYTEKAKSVCVYFIHTLLTKEKVCNPLTK